MIPKFIKITERERILNIKNVITAGKVYQDSVKDQWETDESYRVPVNYDVMLEKLEKLDLNTATHEDVALATGTVNCIGYTHIYCDVCNAVVPTAIEFNSMPTHLTICCDCVKGMNEVRLS